MFTNPALCDMLAIKFEAAKNGTNALPSN
jgi:hypothetical protein